MNISEKTCKSNHEREHVRQGMLPFVINNVYKDIDIHEQQQTGNIHIIIVMISGTESFLPYGKACVFCFHNFLILVLPLLRYLILTANSLILS